MSRIVSLWFCGWTRTFDYFQEQLTPDLFTLGAVTAVLQAFAQWEQAIQLVREHPGRCSELHSALVRHDMVFEGLPGARATRHGGRGRACELLGGQLGAVEVELRHGCAGALRGLPPALRRVCAQAATSMCEAKAWRLALGRWET